MTPQPGAPPIVHNGALLAMLLTAIVWGIAPVFIRTLSLALGPADHLAIRYTLVALAYMAGLAITGQWRIAREDWPRLLLVSAVGMMGYNLGASFGFLHINAGIGALIMGTQPLLIALLAAVAAKERLSTATLAGLALGFAGSALLVWRDIGLGDDRANFLTGCAMVFGGGMCWAVYVVGAKPLIRKYGSYPVTAYSISLCAVLLAALFGRASTVEKALAMTPRSWLEMGYVAVFSTFVATILWNYGASRLSAAAAGAFLYLVPITGVAAGALILGEPVTGGMIAGGGLILAGVAIAQFAPLRNRSISVANPSSQLSQE